MILALILLFLIAYSIYILKYNSNSNSLSQTNLVIPVTDECDNLSGGLKESCKIKISVCTTDECYYNQARLTKNESECFNIADMNTRLVCTSSITQDTIFQNAIILNNLSLCDNLEDTLAKVACRDNYYIVNSINKKDKSYCLNITREVVRNECLQ